MRKDNLGNNSICPKNPLYIRVDLFVHKIQLVVTHTLWHVLINTKIVQQFTRSMHLELK